MSLRLDRRMTTNRARWTAPRLGDCAKVDQCGIRRDKAVSIHFGGFEDHGQRRTHPDFGGGQASSGR